MLVTVLYTEAGRGGSAIDKDNDWNTFHLQHPTGDCVLADIIRTFPLGARYTFSVRSRGGTYVDISNPATPVDVIDGVITAKVIPLANTPQVSMPAVKEEVNRCARMAAARVSRRSSNPSTNQHARRPSAGGGGAWKQEEYISEHGRRRSSDLATNLNLAEVTQNVGKAASGLMKFVGSTVQWATEQLAGEEFVIGDVKVQKVKEMAEGGFSKVYLVRNSATRELLAMKQMLCQSPDSAKAAFLEVQVLRAVNHRCVVRLLDQISTPSKTHRGAREFLLLFPFYRRGTAWDAITAASGPEGTGSWPFPEQTALKLFKDACDGISAIHAAGWSHRDMKPLNILIADDGTGVVMDLGSCAPCRREITSRQEALLLEDEAACLCSAPYRPPELMHIDAGMIIDERVDVWSLGCTLYCLAFGHSPFETPSEGVLKLGIINGRFQFPHGNRNDFGCVYSQGFCDLISYMLNCDHKLRPTMKQVSERLRTVARG